MCWNIHRYSSVQSAASLPHAATERTLGKGWERGFVIYSASLEAVPIKQVFKSRLSNWSWLISALLNLLKASSPQTDSALTLSITNRHSASDEIGRAHV